MVDTAIYPAATWCDCAIDADHIIFARQEGQVIVVTLDGVELWRCTLPEPLLYLRMAVSPQGSIAIVGQSNWTDRLLVVEDGTATLTRYPAHGQDCTAIAWTAQGFRAYVTHVSVPGQGIDMVSVIAVPSLELVAQASIPPTSQGFAQILPNGTWVLRDDLKTAGPFFGWVFARPMGVGGVWVGQSNQAGVLDALLVGLADRVFRVWAGLAQEPHVAVGAGGLIAVCCRGDKTGAVLVRVEPPYSAHEPVPVEPPKEDVLNKPAVKVLHFDGKITPEHWHFTTQDEHNPDLIIDTWTEGGSIFQRITHRGGTARTAQKRPVV